MSNDRVRASEKRNATPMPYDKGKSISILSLLVKGLEGGDPVPTG
jgi:hypothetical protein